MLLKRIRQQGNQTACSLYPELTNDSSFQASWKILSNQVGKKQSTNKPFWKTLADMKSALKMSEGFFSQQYQLPCWKVRWYLVKKSYFSDCSEDLFFLSQTLANVYFQNVPKLHLRNLSYPHCIWYLVSCSELKRNLQLSQKQFLLYLGKKFQHTCEWVQMWTWIYARTYQ